MPRCGMPINSHAAIRMVAGRTAYLGVSIALQWGTSHVMRVFAALAGV